jgi:acetaldehyde dehydrogenase (acetylating)
VRPPPRELPAIALGLRLSSGNIGSDLMIKILRTSKTLELTSLVWS